MQSAAEMPEGSIVATRTQVFIKGDLQGEPALPWRDASSNGMFANINSNDAIDELLADGMGTVLRIGDGTARLAADLPAGTIVASGISVAIKVASPDHPNFPWEVAGSSIKEATNSRIDRYLSNGHVSVVRVGVR